ncbi:1015_t:CDS:2 [Cetraspora pellucida]|uniref:1015_t:CDS:1 n=1 Tax=Cetraspora pellucida TaxID=1433469 RepID=A0ACA9L579_9GLOM|nr:1015_t:CDS:2 [Cetraspora pellucida]
MTTKEMQPMDIDDMQNTDTLGTNFDVLKSGVGKLAEITQLFVPLISSVFIIVLEAVKIYENAKHNKNICASLLMRDNIARTNVEILQLQPRICDHKAFYQFVKVLKKMKDFMNDVSNFMDDIYFTITISNEQQRKLNQENLNRDIKEIKQFLETIAEGVTDMKSHINTVINEVQIINKNVDHLIHDPINNMINLKAVKINSKELDDLPNTETKKSIVKKLYRGNNVACKFQTS